MGRWKKKHRIVIGGKEKCSLCGLATHQRSKLLRDSPKDLYLLAVLVSSHVLFGAFDLEQAKQYFEKCGTVTKRTCRVHFSDAAKQLATELIALGVPFTSYGDGSARYGVTAFVSKRDIPKKFLDRLNEVVKNFDKNLCITEEDVTKFMNEFLWQYLCRGRTNTGWDAVVRLLPGIRRKNTQKPYPAQKPVVVNPVNSSAVWPRLSSLPSNWDLRTVYRTREAVQNGSNGTSYRYETKNSIYWACYPKYDIPSCSSSREVQSNSVFMDNEPISAFDLIRPLPRLATTNPELLQRTITVDVEALLKLFQFCPECGQKLVADGSVQLMLHEDQPVVQYVCDRCSQEGPIIKNWTPLERHS